MGRSGSAPAAFADAGAVGAGLASGDLSGAFLPFRRIRDFLPSPYDRQGAAGLVQEIKALGCGFGFVQGFVTGRNHEPFLPGFDLPAVGLFGDAVDFLAGLGEGDGRAVALRRLSGEFKYYCIPLLFLGVGVRFPPVLSVRPEVPPAEGTEFPAASFR